MDCGSQFTTTDLTYKAPHSIQHIFEHVSCHRQLSSCFFPLFATPPMFQHHQSPATGSSHHASSRSSLHPPCFNVISLLPQAALIMLLPAFHYTPHVSTSSVSCHRQLSSCFFPLFATPPMFQHHRSPATGSSHHASSRSSLHPPCFNVISLLPKAALIMLLPALHYTPHVSTSSVSCHRQLSSCFFTLFTTPPCFNVISLLPQAALIMLLPALHYTPMF